MQHRLHPVPDPHLAEGQGTQHQPAPPGHGAVQQGLGIGGPLGPVHIPHHPLVAGQLNVPAQQDIRRPDQGVEPVYRHQQMAQRLPPVVPAAQMGPLVAQHALQGLPLQPRGQIHPGPENAQDKGGGDVVAEVNLLPHPDGGRHLPPQPQIAHSRPAQHRRHAHQPYPGQVRQGDPRSGGGRLHGRGGGKRRLPRLGPDAENAFRQHRAHQAHRHQPPQQAVAPLGHPPPGHQPHRQDGQHQKSGVGAHTRHRQEDPAQHGHSSFRNLSIIC